MRLSKWQIDPFVSESGNVVICVNRVMAYDKQETLVILTGLEHVGIEFGYIKKQFSCFRPSEAVIWEIIYMKFYAISLFDM